MQAYGYSAAFEAPFVSRTATYHSPSSSSDVGSYGRELFMPVRKEAVYYPADVLPTPGLDNYVFGLPRVEPVRNVSFGQPVAVSSPPAAASTCSRKFRTAPSPPLSDHEDAWETKDGHLDHSLLDCFRDGGLDLDQVEPKRSGALCPAGWRQLADVCIERAFAQRDAGAYSQVAPLLLGAARLYATADGLNGPTAPPLSPQLKDVPLTRTDSCVPPAELLVEVPLLVPDQQPKSRWSPDSEDEAPGPKTRDSDFSQQSFVDSGSPSDTPGIRAPRPVRHKVIGHEVVEWLEGVAVRRIAREAEFRRPTHGPMEYRRFEDEEEAAEAGLRLYLHGDRDWSPAY